jgi:hypothetical protein
MDFFNVRRRLRWWQLDRSLDPIKYEGNHLFVTGEVTITLFKFFVEMGSFPSTCPVTSGWGKTEWIP